MTTQISFEVRSPKGPHRTLSVHPIHLDAVMAKYLPASPRDLRTIVESRTGIDYADVHEVSTFLLILADLDYPTT